MRPVLLLTALVALACTPSRGDGRDDEGDEESGTTDAGSTDAGSTDAGSTDAGSTDAGSTDAGSTDAGSTDAGSTDGGLSCPEAAACGSRRCGGDPVCGVSCGTCASGESCEAGACVPIPAGGTVNGSVGGKSFTPVDAIAHGSTSSMVVELTSRSGTCEVVQRGHYAGGATYVALVVGSNTTLAPGTYTIGSGLLFPPTAFFSSADAQCNGTGFIEATAGTITFTRLGLAPGVSTEGSYDLRFGTDRLQGTFRAATCDPFPEERIGCE